jgi:hypothetical protein
MSVPFGPKNAWIAVPDISPEELAAALGFGTLEPAEWEPGVNFCYTTAGRNYRGVGVFVTPPLGRWTLCVGIPLFELKKGFSAALSARLGGREVQYFATHRVSEGHVLERAIAGEMTRYFYYCGGDGEEAQEGEPTPEERAHGFKINPPDGQSDDDEDYWFADEDFILAVAGAWSVDPSLIGTDIVAPGPGFTGRADPAGA